MPLPGGLCQTEAKCFVFGSEQTDEDALYLFCDISEKNYAAYVYVIWFDGNALS